MNAVSDPDTSTPKTAPVIENRLLIELEFVQNLCNPKYLNFLAQRGYFEQESFLQFLAYLQYWKQPEYSQHLAFPQCLAFLDAILTDKNFRREAALPQFAEYVHRQQGSKWMMDSKSEAELDLALASVGDSNTSI
jgi:hypothetical protein